MTLKKILWTMVIAAAAVGVTLFLLHRAHRLRTIAEQQSVPLEGAVLQRDSDPDKQLPIAGASVTATDGLSIETTQSDAAGYFKLVLHKRVLSEHPITLSFRNDGYEPLDVLVQTGRLQSHQGLSVARMSPVVAPAITRDDRPPMAVSNVKVRYTINARTETSVGSAVKTFKVVNQGNVPCKRPSLCSPDGRWKASSTSVSLDAGQDNSFANVRASCIAGPCPFTRIDSNGFIHGGRTIRVSALNWSDTATFLVEAEVYHTAIGANLRELYPVIFGRTLNFTMPPTQEGVSLEADLAGVSMVFPLGPVPVLSWATCSVRTGTEEEKATVYRCALKPGYHF